MCRVAAHNNAGTAEQLPEVPSEVLDECSFIQAPLEQQGNHPDYSSYRKTKPETPLRLEQGQGKPGPEEVREEVNY